MVDCFRLADFMCSNEVMCWLFAVWCRVYPDYNGSPNDLWPKGYFLWIQIYQSVRICGKCFIFSVFFFYFIKLIRYFVAGKIAPSWKSHLIYELSISLTHTLWPLAWKMSSIREKVRQFYDVIKPEINAKQYWYISLFIVFLWNLFLLCFNEFACVWIKASPFDAYVFHFGIIFDIFRRKPSWM